MPRRYRKPQRGQVVQAFLVAVQRHSLDTLQIEHKYGQPTAGSDGAVLLTQRTRRRVARVFKWLPVAELLLLHQLQKSIAGHIYFSPHFQKVRRSVWQALRDILYRREILRYVFPHNAVAPGGAPNKNTIPVFQADGEAVYLCLHHILRRQTGLPHSRVEFPDFIQ